MHHGDINPTEKFLGGKSDVYARKEQASVDYGLVSPETFSHRLTMLFNTYWQLSMAPESTTGDKVMSRAPNYDGEVVDLFAGMYPCNVTWAKTSNPVTVYHANKTWIAVFLTISLIVQLCAIAGVILKYTTNAPNILGYVSTMTRDNPYTPLPDGGQTPDGMERARLLKDMRVPI